MGVTGPPGGGKSTLVAALVARRACGGRAVAVLAIDPSSPITGGAILGDRIRMQQHAGDPDVFIRSMASRGHLGGLAGTTAESAAALDACGFGLVLIETVGTGQSEVEVASVADTTVVVQAPEMGDEVQALKAGLLEVADLVVVNKADRPGADRAARSCARCSPWCRAGAGEEAAGARGPPEASQVLLASGVTGRRAGAARRARSASRRRADDRPAPRRPPRPGACPAQGILAERMREAPGRPRRPQPMQPSSGGRPRADPYTAADRPADEIGRRPSDALFAELSSATLSWPRTRPLPITRPDEVDPPPRMTCRAA